MPKQILLYGRIDSYAATEFNECLQEMQESAPIDELTLRINTPGGEPEYGWGIISMFKDLDCIKKVKVDGQAHSMGAFILCYVNEAETLDVAEFLIHRAAYPSWIESSEMFDQATKDNLIRINQSLEKAFRAKVDVAMFEQMKGVKVKDIFSMDQRLDVYLTAKEAKKIGLVNKITTLTSDAANEIKAYAKAAESGKGIFVPTITENNNEFNQNQNHKKMTAAEFKAAHPAEYAALQQEAINAERDRVGALLAFIDVDQKSIVEAVKKGDALTGTMAAELTRKAVSKAAVSALADDSAKDIQVGDEGAEGAEDKAKKESEKNIVDFMEAAKKIAVKQII
jgi:ATP-dependent protease ClpP protease subunit